MTEVTTQPQVTTEVVEAPISSIKEAKPEIINVAKNNLKGITDFNFDDIDKQVEVEGSVENLGLDLQRDVANKSSLLSTTVGDLSENTESGNLADSLISLRTTVETVNPKKFDFEPGFFTKLVGKVFPKALSRPMQN